MLWHCLSRSGRAAFTNTSSFCRRNLLHEGSSPAESFQHVTAPSSGFDFLFRTQQSDTPCSFNVWPLICLSDPRALGCIANRPQFLIRHMAMERGPLSLSRLPLAPSATLPTYVLGPFNLWKLRCSIRSTLWGHQKPALILSTLSVTVAAANRKSRSEERYMI